MPESIESLEEFQKLISGDKVVAVDFTATWCGPCQRIGPKFVEYSVEYTNAVFVKVDVDEAQEIAAEYKIRAMPTFKFFKAGAEIGDMVGADEAKLKQLCETYCKVAMDVRGPNHLIERESPLNIGRERNNNNNIGNNVGPSDSPLGMSKQLSYRKPLKRHNPVQSSSLGGGTPPFPKLSQNENANTSAMHPLGGRDVPPTMKRTKEESWSAGTTLSMTEIALRDHKGYEKDLTRVPSGYGRGSPSKKPFGQSMIVIQRSPSKFRPDLHNQNPIETKSESLTEWMRPRPPQLNEGTAQPVDSVPETSPMGVNRPPPLENQSIPLKLGAPPGLVPDLLAEKRRRMEEQGQPSNRNPQQLEVANPVDEQRHFHPSDQGRGSGHPGRGGRRDYRNDQHDLSSAQNDQRNFYMSGDHSSERRNFDNNDNDRNFWDNRDDRRFGNRDSRYDDRRDFSINDTGNFRHGDDRNNEFRNNGGHNFPDDNNARNDNRGFRHNERGAFRKNTRWENDHQRHFNDRRDQFNSHHEQNERGNFGNDQTREFGRNSRGRDENFRRDSNSWSNNSDSRMRSSERQDQQRSWLQPGNEAPNNNTGFGSDQDTQQNWRNQSRNHNVWTGGNQQPSGAPANSIPGLQQSDPFQRREDEQKMEKFSQFQESWNSGRGNQSVTSAGPSQATVHRTNQTPYAASNFNSYGQGATGNSQVMTGGGDQRGSEVVHDDGKEIIVGKHMTSLNGNVLPGQPQYDRFYSQQTPHNSQTQQFQQQYSAPSGFGAKSIPPSVPQSFAQSAPGFNQQKSVGNMMSGANMPPQNTQQPAAFNQYAAAPYSVQNAIFPSLSQSFSMQPSLSSMPYASSMSASTAVTQSISTNSLNVPAPAVPANQNPLQAQPPQPAVASNPPPQQMNPLITPQVTPQMMPGCTPEQIKEYQKQWDDYKVKYEKYQQELAEYNKQMQQIYSQSAGQGSVNMNPATAVGQTQPQVNAAPVGLPGSNPMMTVPAAAATPQNPVAQLGTPTMTQNPAQPIAFSYPYQQQQQNLALNPMASTAQTFSYPTGFYPQQATPQQNAPQPNPLTFQIAAANPMMSSPMMPPWMASANQPSAK